MLALLSLRCCSLLSGSTLSGGLALRGTLGIFASCFSGGLGGFLGFTIGLCLFLLLGCIFSILLGGFLLLCCVILALSGLLILLSLGFLFLAILFGLLGLFISLALGFGGLTSLTILHVLEHLSLLGLFRSGFAGSCGGILGGGVATSLCSLTLGLDVFLSGCLLELGL